MLAGIEELQRVARSGRVGQPVFFRCLVRCEPAMAEDAVVEALAAAAAVIGDRPRTLLTHGEAEAGTLHAVLDFAGGPSALVAVGPGEPAWDAMPLGNHGAVYLEGAPCSPTNDERPTTNETEVTLGVFPAPPPLRRSPRGPRWSLVVRRALATGRPESAGEISDE